MVELQHPQSGEQQEAVGELLQMVMAQEELLQLRETVPEVCGQTLEALAVELQDGNLDSFLWRYVEGMSLHSKCYKVG